MTETLRDDRYRRKLLWSSWVFAAGIGLGLVIGGEGLMRIARRRRPD
jgi:hypothetical protein